MNFKRLLQVMLCGILVTFIGCAKSQSGNETIKLGVLAPLTGTNAEYGRGFQVAMQMAVERINAGGGVNGRMLELVVRDSKGDPRESSDLARQFGDDESIYAILGDFTSGASMANAPIVDAAGIVQISPTASHPDYTSMSPYTFGIMGRQDSEAPFFAQHLIYRHMGVRNVGVMYINSDWGQSAFGHFQTAANSIGLNIPVAVNYVQDERDFSSLITRLRATPNLEAIVLMDQGAVPQIINQIRGAGWNIPLTTLGPGTSQQILDLSGANAEGLLLSTPFFFDEDNPELMGWKNEFVSRAGFQPTVHPACAYDTVLLIAEAIRASGNNVSRSSIRENLQNIDFVGLTGPIRFNPSGDITRQYLISGVEDGRFVVKAGFEFANE